MQNTTTPFASYLDAEIGRAAELARYLSDVLGKRVHKQQISRIKHRAHRFPSQWMQHVVKWSKRQLSLDDLAKYADKA